MHVDLQRGTFNHQHLVSTEYASTSSMVTPVLRKLFHTEITDLGTFATSCGQRRSLPGWYFTHLRGICGRGEAGNIKHRGNLCCFPIHSSEKSFKVSQDAILGTQKPERQDNYLQVHTYILRERDRIIY